MRTKVVKHVVKSKTIYTAEITPAPCACCGRPYWTEVREFRSKEKAEAFVAKAKAADKRNK